MGEERARLRYEEVKSGTQKKVAEGRAELERQERNLSNGREMLSVILNMLGLPLDFEEAEKQLDSYEKLKEPMQEIFAAFENGEEALSAGWEKLAQSEKSAENIEYYEWIVSVRNDIGDVRSVEIAVQGLYGLSYSMAIIFVIVAVVVCYAAISRMISESRTLIGMQKALGFSAREIMRHFMSYSILCGIGGILGGWIEAYVVVQNLNLHLYKTVK